MLFWDGKPTLWLYPHGVMWFPLPHEARHGVCFVHVEGMSEYMLKRVVVGRWAHFAL